MFAWEIRERRLLERVCDSKRVLSISSINRVVHRRRETITALPLYYSGGLLKKSKKEKDFKKYHAELRGTTLFLYKDFTQDTYTEKLELEGLKSVESDAPCRRKVATVYTLRLPTEEVKLKTDSADTGETWRVYILTVIHRTIPCKLQMLPGQVLQLQEVLSQEKRRIQLLKTQPPVPPRPSPLNSPPQSEAPADRSNDVPACFFKVTRQKAEHMLEANPEYGGIILRPSSLANNYALTIRQVMPRSDTPPNTGTQYSGPVIKNYRVSCTRSGFVIELLRGVTVPSLDDIVNYVREKTEYRIHPYMPSQLYDTHIDVPPQVPRTVPRAEVVPMPQSNTRDLRPPPSEAGDSEYMTPDLKPAHSPDDHKLKLAAQLDVELQEVLKRQRDLVYDSTEDVDTTYQN